MSTEIDAPEAVASLRNVGGSIGSIVDDLRDSASVESVYGDPVEAGDVTVIPVAKVAYGFGGGFDRGGDDESEDGGEGGGIGGGVSATPVGVLEVTAGGTRFVRFGERRMRLAALAVGLVLGLLLGRRRSEEG